MDEQRQTAEIAPVYDCGSCLYPQLTADKMPAVLGSEDEINSRILTFPASAIEEDGQKISYFEFIPSLKDEGCNAALRRVHGRIDMEQLTKIVEGTPGLLPVQREFYRVMLQERKAKILDYSMELLLAQEQGSIRQDGQQPTM